MSNARIRQVARQALARLGVKRFAKADGSPEPIAKPDKAPVFYSHAERVIHEKVPNSAHPDQVRKTLLNNGVKPEEMKWSGLEDHLATATGPVKKTDLLERVRDGNVKVGEVLKKSEPQDMSGPAPGWASVGGGETKYDEYQLPGGTNYHEMLLTLPTKPNPTVDRKKEINSRLEFIQNEHDRLGGEHVTDELKMYRKKLYEERQGLVNELSKIPDSDGQSDDNFKSSHWSEPNVLAHIRFNDREGTNGEKLLHVEEVQSDWGQEHRKRRERILSELKEDFKSITDKMSKDGLITKECD